MIFTTKLIDGRFPDYERVIPDQATKQMHADRDTIRQALSRTAILSNEKFGGVRLALNDHSLRLQAQNVEREEAEDEIQVTYDHEPIEIGFNARYLLDIAQQIEGDEAEFIVADAASPTIVRDSEDDSALYVLMPMRV